jgi:hypothetical protein
LEEKSEGIINMAKRLATKAVLHMILPSSERSKLARMNVDEAKGHDNEDKGGGGGGVSLADVMVRRGSM